MPRSSETAEFEALFADAAPSRSEQLFPLILASLTAAASADALGWVTEFMRSPAAIPRKLGVARVDDYVGWRKEVGGRFNTYIDYIAPGEYSDDTQLTLAVARAVSADGSVDQEYFAKRELVRWLDYARGAGRTVIAAARGAARKRTPWYENFFRAGKLDYWDSGANGAAMRISPIVLANVSKADPPMEQVFANAIVTHGHPRAHIGALAYAIALHEIMLRRQERAGTDPFLSAIRERLRSWHPRIARSSPVRQWFAAAQRRRPDWSERYDRTLDEFDEMLNVVRRPDTEAVLKQLGCFERETRGSGIGTVAAGLHLFCRHGANTERAVIEAVNAVPGDTDTIGAFVGSMTGLYGGYDTIPERWTQRLQDLPYIVSLSEALSQIAAGDAPPGGTLQPRPSKYERGLPDVMERLKAGELERDMRVRHDVLGTGSVKAIHAQAIRRRGGGQMIYARVELDIGQQCQFRAHLPAPAGSRAS
jgi:ADP-ribosylglycohydrolase